MSAKPFPPYLTVGDGLDSWIEDRTGAIVVQSVKLSYHYAAVFEETNLMQLLCDALNKHAEEGDQ